MSDVTLLSPNCLNFFTKAVDNAAMTFKSFAEKLSGTPVAGYSGLWYTIAQSTASEIEKIAGNPPKTMQIKQNGATPQSADRVDSTPVGC
jgi:hypothetical protein